MKAKKVVLRWTWGKSIKFILWEVYESLQAKEIMKIDKNENKLD